jgi:hypothetical protein
MHRGGSGSLRDFDWSERRWNSSQAYSDSKLYLTALAFAIARRWPVIVPRESILDVGGASDVMPIRIAFASQDVDESRPDAAHGAAPVVSFAPVRSC